MNILLTNTGRRNYFVNFLNKLNKNNKIKIFIADCTLNTASFYTENKVYKKIITPRASLKKKYFNSIYKIARKNKINLIIPLSELDLKILSKNKKKFSKIDCFPVVSDPKVIDICQNKKKLYYFCKINKINTPDLFFSKKEIKFPLVKKYIKSSGSKEIQIYRNKEKFKLNFKNFLYQKFIKGQEYNIDILNDFKKNFISCCIKKKLLMRSGETDKCEIVNNKLIEEFSKLLSKKLGHIGNLDCDIILTKNNKINLIDLNPRFGGGYPFTHLAGNNYIKYILDILRNKKLFIRKKSLRIFAMKGISLHSYQK